MRAFLGFDLMTVLLDPDGSHGFPHLAIKPGGLFPGRGRGSMTARMSPYRRVALRFLALLAVVAMPMMARADTQDITAASRSVVRVALVATDGDSAYFVGHGSGVVVAPGKVLTNAHVVEVTRTEPNIVIGIIPPEGKKSYGGRVIAYSPGNALALISYDQSANLPVAT